MPKKDKNNNTSLNLTEAFKQLEQITSEFEKGEVSLEESIPKFKKGLELAKFLKQELKKLENQIIEIKDQFKDMDTPVSLPDDETN